MREGAKKRLIGAVVIVALAVIFVPMLFEPEPLDRLPPIQQSIPRPPAFQPGVKTETFLSPQDTGIGGPDPAAPKVSEPLDLPPPPDSGGREEPVAAPRERGVPAAPTARPQPAPPARAPEPARPSRVAPPEAPTQGGSRPGAAPQANGGRGGAAGNWVVQVASIPNQASAAELESKLKAGGYPAFIEKAEVNGRTTYRVQVGPEADRARAEQTAARLRDKHKVQPLIRNYP